jgi:CheY-like chemotaxis protein
LKILVVDDDPIFRGLVSKSLQKAGYEILTAPDAKTALGLLERELVVMVITDLMMPEMDGLGFVEYMRKTPHLSHIPVLVCSASGIRETVVKAARLNAKGYLVKPVDIQQLRDRVRQVMDVQLRPVSDLGAVLARLDLTAGSYFEVLNSFVKEISSLIEQMEKALAAGTGKAPRDAVASLQGAAKNLGTERVADVLERLHAKLQQEDVSQVQPLYLELKKEVALLQRFAEGQGKEHTSNTA